MNARICMIEGKCIYRHNRICGDPFVYRLNSDAFCFSMNFADVYHNMRLVEDHGIYGIGGIYDELAEKRTKEEQNEKRFW